MNLNMIYIANIPYRNKKAKEYSNKIRRNCIIRSIIISILIGSILGILHIISTLGII